MGMIRLKRINLLEQVEIPLITALKGLVRLLAPVYLGRALKKHDQWYCASKHDYFTDLTQTRVLGRAQRIPVVVVSRPHEPLKQEGFFLVRPVLSPGTSGIFIRIDGLLSLPSTFGDMAGQNVISLFALRRVSINAESERAVRMCRR